MANYSLVHSVRVCTEFTPETFGRLTTMGPGFMLPVGSKGRSRKHQVCQCACGTIQSYGMSNLIKGDTKSCGCLQKEITVARSVTHGMTKTAEYKSWQKMRSRCDDPTNNQYHNYGGRGITYCERWKKFENFFADMGNKPSRIHSLDRKENNGNYEKSNCRWATPKEQGSNKRNNHLVEIAGKTDTFANWCRYFGLQFSTVKRRIRKGWTPALALSTPAGPTGPKRKTKPNG
jgi:hypothetical protein